MKKNIYMIVIVIAFAGIPCLAAAPNSHNNGHGISVRAANYGGGMRGSYHSMNRAPIHASASIRHDFGRPPIARPPHYLTGPPIHHMAGRPPMRPIYRPYRPVPYRPIVYRPYYSPFYYPTTTYYSTYTSYPLENYVYEGVSPISSTVNTVVVRDNYAGVNTAANVINVAANAATAIRFLSW